MTQNIDETLKERQGTHGEYTDNARVGQELKDVYRKQPGWNRLSPEQRETMDMIAHKQARILGGNPDEKDHWHDIAGYAKLVVDRIQKIIARRRPLHDQYEKLAGGVAVGVPQVQVQGFVTNTPRSPDDPRLQFKMNDQGQVTGIEPRVPRVDAGANMVKANAIMEQQPGVIGRMIDE